MAQKEFFIYGTNFAALAPAVTSSNTLNIQADSAFEVQKLAFTASIAGAALTDATRILPQCSLIILDTGSGRQLMNQAIDLNTFFGTGSEPFILPVTKIFRANSAITFSLTNKSAAETYNISISLIGAKVYGAM